MTKISENKLKERILYFGSQLQKFKFIMMRNRAVLFLAGRKQRKGNTGKGQGMVQPSTNTTQHL